MQDRPTAVELLTSVREFIEQDVLPGLEGRKRFHALVSANVLAIVARELAGEEDDARRGVGAPSGAVAQR
jgi:hypothetical protein